MTPAKMKSGVKLPSHCSIAPATSSMSMPPMPPHMPPNPSTRSHAEQQRILLEAFSFGKGEPL